MWVNGNKNNSRPNENSLIVKLQLIITKALNLLVAKARMAQGTIHVLPSWSP